MIAILGLLVSLRNSVSRLIGRFTERNDWQPDFPSFDTKDQYLNYMRDFCENHYHWTSDPVYGLLDNVQSIKHMNWQLKKKGIIEGDCDDLATYSCYFALKLFAYKTYRINIISERHVIGVIELRETQDSPSKYYWVSNHQVDTEAYNTLEECIKAFTENDKAMLFIEKLVLKDSAYDRIAVA